MYLREEPARLWAVFGVGSALICKSDFYCSTIKHVDCPQCVELNLIRSGSMCCLQHCLKPQVSESLMQAGVHLWDKHAVQDGKETGGGWEPVTMGTETLGVLKGGEVFPVSWLYGPVSSRHTHISVPHNDHTHTNEFHRFGGRNRQTSKREKTCLLCKPFKVWAVVTANQITRQQPRKLKEEKKSTIHSDDDS